VRVITKIGSLPSVKNTGEGIDPSMLPRLFTKFTSKSYHGTGLGLFISKPIVEAHGGKIWAKNNENVDGVRSDIFIQFARNVTQI